MTAANSIHHLQSHFLLLVPALMKQELRLCSWSLHQSGTYQQQHPGLRSRPVHTGALVTAVLAEERGAPDVKIADTAADCQWFLLEHWRLRQALLQLLHWLGHWIPA